MEQYITQRTMLFACLYNSYHILFDAKQTIRSLVRGDDIDAH